MHLYATYSLSLATSLPDGGESVALLLAFLLAIASISNDKKWAWKPSSERKQVYAVHDGVAAAAIIMLRVQLAYIYLDATVAKFGIADWANGTASYYVVNSPMFGDAGPLASLSSALVGNPLGVLLLSWGPLVLEVIVGLGILGTARLRKIAVFTDILLHAGFIIFIGLFSFSLVMIAAVLAASTIPVEKGYLELEDDKNVENFVDCREIRTVFKPTWVSWWFHKIFTFPRVECDGIVSNCRWGRDKALVRDGGTVTVGFSYRIFHDTKIRCKSSPIEVSPSHAELEAKTAIINNSPMTAVLY